MTVLDDLPTTYEPKKFEADIRRFWEDGGYFRADPGDASRPVYTIVIPPPNVTGALHGGHALNNTLQDILIRWHRMRGFNTLWMPGTDHAGIATQAVVERTVFEQERKTRHDLGREELVRRIWEWKEAYGNRILEQLKLMGCSCDWSRTRFTLDDVCARAVRHTFFRLFKDGLIVRGKRLVNWDTHLQTAVADDEVYHETVKGHFYEFKYPVIDPKPGEPRFVHIATTRPETMLGDTAVAVHPDPEGYFAAMEAQLKQSLPKPVHQELELPLTGEALRETRDVESRLEVLQERRRTHLVALMRLRDMALDGRRVKLPLVDRPIPLVCDEWADPLLGTGCVKITPAHDPNDWAVGERHKLAVINVLTPDGRVAKLERIRNENARKYEGMRFSTDARKAVVADLEALGLVEKIEDRQVEIGHSDRSKTPIEPFLSDQWFVSMGDLPAEQAAKIEGLRGKPGLAQLAMDAIAEEPLSTPEQRRDSGQVAFFPARYRKTYLDWLGEKRDWCISRQLWWGHRIPIWYAKPERRVPPPGQFRPGEMVNLRGLERLSVPYWISPYAQRVWHGPPRADGSEAFFAESTVYVCVDGEPTEQDLRILDECGLEQDPDVLDTWFSSALWPHSTMGWPEDTPEMRRYYPGSVLSTAREIITLWVARMVLTGLYNVGKVPFHDVYIHAVIQDGQGRPFKKTLGNGFDPVDIIEVYGADALRYTMASLTTETQDIRMPMKRVRLDDGRELQTSERFELGRNFCNKLWNAARFAFMNLEGTGCVRLDPGSLAIEDRWILSQVSRAATEVQSALLGFQFSRAINAARDFFWDNLCDWYLELVKPRIAARTPTEPASVKPASPERDAPTSQEAGLAEPGSDRGGGADRRADEARQVLAFVLDQALRLLHPFVPFITEMLWSNLNRLVPKRGLPGVVECDCDDALIAAAYPPVEGYPALNAPEVDAVFADLQTATRAVRDIRQTQNVAPKQAVDVSIRVPPARVASLEHEAQVIQKLANVGRLTVGADVPKPPNAATLVIGDMQIFVANVIDPAAERQRLEKDLVGFDKQIAAIEGKLANESFTSRAPAEVVARERERLAELRAKRETVVSTMKELRGIGEP